MQENVFSISKDPPERQHADKNKIISNRLKILFTKISIKSFLRL